MFTTAWGRFRLVAIGEGLSFISLLFVAMPLKYTFGVPQAVTIVGWVHGVLFTLYMIALTGVVMKDRWRISHAFSALGASALPFATFAFNWYMKKEYAKGVYE